MAPSLHVVVAAVNIKELMGQDPVPQGQIHNWRVDRYTTTHYILEMVLDECKGWLLSQLSGWLVMRGSPKRSHSFYRVESSIVAT